MARGDRIRWRTAWLLFAPETHFVAVHDAARPLVRPELIELFFARAGTWRSGQRDTGDRHLKAAQTTITSHWRASTEPKLFAVQTPQIFRRDLLEKAYRAVGEAGLEMTDEISAFEHVGEKVVLVPNDEPNFKITYPADLPLAEFVLRGERALRD